MICFLAAIVTYAFGVQSDNTKSELAYLLIKQSLLIISTDIHAYSRNICTRLVGDLASLSLLPSLKSPACLKEPRRVFVPRSWFKSAVNLAIALKNK